MSQPVNIEPNWSLLYACIYFLPLAEIVHHVIFMGQVSFQHDRLVVVLFHLQYPGYYED